VTAAARHNFDAQDLVIACLVALLAQLGFVAVFSLPSPKLVQVEISNDNAQPIAVSITPVLKLGSKTPGKLPSRWTRRPPAAKTPPPQQAALPSTQAEKTAEAIPKSNVPDASIAPVLEPLKSLDSNLTATADAAPGPVAAASTEGSEQGAANGTETDALKGRAADMYRAQLASWFASHFQIRGKVPFDQLKTLHATATVTVTADRKVGSFTLVKPSGDPTFDEEVKATLARVQSGGTELPAPPPLYPDLLGQSLPVGFQCSVRRNCE
jgi:outer membrane biosynthesis protein TonB